MYPTPLWTNHWNSIVAKFIARPRLLIACDFDGVLYAGNHGLEIDSPGILWTSAEAREHRPELALALVELRREIGAVPGVIIEDKQLTGTVHWRQVDPDLRPELHLKVEEIVS